MKSIKLVRARVTQTLKGLRLLGDIHYGASNCDRVLFQKVVDNARDCDDWIFLMGDLIENSDKGSPGASVYEQTMPPQQQREEIHEILYPVRDLILGSLTGNHCERTYYRSGHDISEVIASKLGVPYCRYGAFLQLGVNNQTYIVYAIHGSFGGRERAGKLTALSRFVPVRKADVFAMGHVHTMDHEGKPRYWVNTRYKTIVKEEYYLVLTGHFLNYDDSYAEAKGYEPGRMGAARIVFSGDKREISINTENHGLVHRDTDHNS